MCLLIGEKFKNVLTWGFLKSLKPRDLQSRQYKDRRVGVATFYHNPSGRAVIQFSGPAMSSHHQNNIEFKTKHIQPSKLKIRGYFWFWFLFIYIIILIWVILLIFVSFSFFHFWYLHKYLFVLGIYIIFWTNTNSIHLKLNQK